MTFLKVLEVTKPRHTGFVLVTLLMTGQS